MAIMTRWRCAARKLVAGRTSSRVSGSGMPTSSSSSRMRFPPASPVSPWWMRRPFADLLVERVQGVERGHRLLEDEGDIVCPHPPQPRLVGAHHLTPFVEDRPRDRGTVGQEDSPSRGRSPILPDPLFSPTSAIVSPRGQFIGDPPHRMGFNGVLTKPDIKRIDCEKSG